LRKNRAAVDIFHFVYLNLALFVLFNFEKLSLNKLFSQEKWIFQQLDGSYLEDKLNSGRLLFCEKVDGSFLFFLNE